MKRQRIIFRSVLGIFSVLLVLSGMQILFEIPVLPFLRTAAETVGCCLPDDSLRTNVLAAYSDGKQIAVGDVTINSYPALTVQRGIPVEFTLNVEQESICDDNENLTFPDFGVENVRLVPGENTVNFMPDESGVFPFGCVSGSIKSTITVVESLGFTNNNSPAESSSVSTPDPVDPVLDVSSLNESEIYSSDAHNNDSNTSIGGWLEQQLVPSGAAEGVHVVKSWTGWIFDRDCIGISPMKHTKACNLMGSCFDSGLGIIEYIPDEELDVYTAEESFHLFDGASKELAAAFLNSLPEEWKNNITVAITGYAVNNIPASADEMLIPESDSSRVDHYLNGIHITSIETVYIDGVSTNQLPDPNKTLTQP